jgi:hypothetical protein
VLSQSALCFAGQTEPLHRGREGTNSPLLLFRAGGYFEFYIYRRHSPPVTSLRLVQPSRCSLRSLLWGRGTSPSPHRRPCFAGSGSPSPLTYSDFVRACRGGSSIVAEQAGLKFSSLHSVTGGSFSPSPPCPSPLQGEGGQTGITACGATAVF